MMDLIVKLNQERTVITVEHRMKLVMGISDRIVVLHHGRVAGVRDVGATDHDEIIALITGDEDFPSLSGRKRLGAAS